MASRTKVYRLKNAVFRDGKMVVPQWARVVHHMVDGEQADITVAGNPVCLRVPSSDVVNLKGLTVYVLRHADGSDCTNKGVTSRYKSFVLVDPQIAPIFGETEDCPAIHIVRRKLGGCEYRHAEAVDDQVGGKWLMMGGNFVYGCDSRVINAATPYGVLPVHDRVE